MSVKILASILSADLLHLDEEVTNVMSAGADMIHIDIMDNHYVPNLTFGPMICKALHQRFPKHPLDVHLMVSPVDKIIHECIEAGAERISIHPNACLHLDRNLQQIKDQHCEAGLVLNPSVSIDAIRWCLPYLDFVLVMTVNPGFAAQKLIPQVIKKIELIHETYPKLPIAVDGGIHTSNISALMKAGASQFVIGSALFGSKNYHQTIAEIRSQCI